MSTKKPDAKQLLYNLIATLPKCWCGEPAMWDAVCINAGWYLGPSGWMCHYHGSQWDHPNKDIRAELLPYAKALQAAVVNKFDMGELRALGFVLRPAWEGTSCVQG